MERTELQAVSQLRVEEAEVLLREGYYSGAYYLLGYAVECALKACIARRIIAHVIPDRRFIQAVYQHNLEQLLSLTDLSDQMKSERDQNPELSDNWSTVKDWSVDVRYDPTVIEQVAQAMHRACTDPENGVLPWLRRYW